ncbi:MAG: hypothetical protein JWQ96_2824 [Segetibacter sp.]|nr:hypothetical protein [Segetibacter sp.]
MRKLLVILLLTFSVLAQAQNEIIQVEGKAPELYLTHIVAPKESYYSVARMYNQAPKLIATFNGLQLEKGLNIGQVIKVPVTSKNFEVNDKAGADETLIPVHHIVAKSETLFRIGNNHGSSLDAVRKWNNLSNDNIEIGTPLIVGHLKVKNDQVALFNAAPPVESATASAPVLNPVTEAKQETKTFERVTSKTTPEKQQEGVKSAAPTDTVTRKPEVLPVSKEAIPAEQKKVIEEKPAVEEKKIQNAAPETTTANVSNIDLSSAGGVAPAEGVFAGTFSVSIQDKNLVNKSGEAATFKSTSGWQDKKYYALINDVPVGTIVKISAGDKAVFAKVLDSMPQMKENNGLLIRLSNSAASYLGIIDPKFPVQVSYYQ